MLGEDTRRTGKSSQSGSGKVVNRPQESVVTLLEELEARQCDIGSAMAAAIVREVAPMRAVSRHDPSFGPRFERFCQEHVRTFLDTTRQGRVAGPQDLAFVREVAERRADDAFPLPALMDGLRVGHRVLNHRIRQLGSGWNTPAAAVLALTTRLIEYMDAVGSELAEAFRTRQALSLSRLELVRREILEDVLEGRYAARIDAGLVAASVGFEPDQQYSVAVLVATAAGAQATQALATEVNRAASSIRGLRFVVVRGDEVVAIFRTTDVTPVVETISVQARVGVSTSCRGIGEIARGYWEAARAIRFTSDTEPYVDLSRLGPLRYLEFSADSIARQLAEHYLGALREGVLADTLLMYVDTGLNARLTAERMGVHLNTVHNRLERVADLLHRPDLGPIDCLEAATALRICSRSG